MKTVREGWVVFDTHGNMLTETNDIEKDAWIEASGRYCSTEEHRQYLRRKGCKCLYVEVTIRKKKPPAKQTAGEMIQALRDAGLSAWDDVTIEELDDAEVNAAKPD